MCDHIKTLQKGGQSKKSAKGRGRSKGLSPVAVVTYIHETAPLSFSFTGATVVDSPSTQCPMCKCTLNRPLELVCGVMVCAECCCNWINNSHSLTCPCCYNHMLNELTVKSPSSVVMDLLHSALHLKCNSCQKVISAKEYPQHSCHHTTASPSRFSAKDMLERPLTAPQNPLEKRVAEHLVRKLMVQSSSGGTLTVPTQGKV